MQHNYFFIYLFLFFLSFIACYSIFLFNRLSFGTYSPYLPILKDVSRREFFLLISLLIPTFLLGIFPNIILDTLHSSVTNLLYDFNLPLLKSNTNLFL